MELHQLRRFSILAEELHFTRAAERLHIEQSPLSRTIKELEDDLGVRLFARDRRGTRLTSAGNVFLQDVRRVFTALEHARANVRAVASGSRGSLHIALSDGMIDPRLSAFLARCREEEPEVEIRLSEVSLTEQVRGLRTGDFMLGFAYTADVAENIHAEPIWTTPLVVVMPLRHPLLVYKEIPLHALAPFPLILCDSQRCEGYCRELSRLLYSLEHAFHVAERTSSPDMMLTLVGAGYGVGFVTANRLTLYRHADIITRPLAAKATVMTTYLLRLENGHPSDFLDRFTQRLHHCGHQVNLPQ